MALKLMEELEKAGFSEQVVERMRQKLKEKIAEEAAQNPSTTDKAKVPDDEAKK